MWDEIRRKPKISYFNNNDLVFQFKVLILNIIVCRLECPNIWHGLLIYYIYIVINHIKSEVMFMMRL